MDSTLPIEERRNAYFQTLEDTKYTVWEIDKILAEKEIDDSPKFLVQWKYWPRGASTWELQENLAGNDEILHEWEVEKRASQGR